MASSIALPLAIGIGMVANISHHDAADGRPNASGCGASACLVPSSMFSWISNNDDARISRRPDVCGGVARIKGTRITVWGLEEARRLEGSDDILLEDFPSLTRADLDAAWEYVAAHQDEINQLIALNNE